MKAFVEKFDKGKIGQRIKFPYFVLAFSLMLTAGTTLLFYQNAKSKDAARFTTRVNRVRYSIENRIGLYVALLKASRGYIESTRDIDRQKYAFFINSLEVEKNYNGSQGIGFTKTVRPEEINQFLESVKQEGQENYKIFPEGEREVYQPIVYLEPMDPRNQQAIGFDMASEPQRWNAMQRARDTGTAQATGRVVLVQENEQDRQFGFLIYLPIYKDAVQPESLEERQRNLVGFVYSPFRARNFLRDVQNNAGTKDLVITLYDGEPTTENFLAQTPIEDEKKLFREEINLPEQIGGTYSDISRVEIGGRTWTFRCDSLPSFAVQSSVGWTPLILLCGLIFSLLLFGLIYWESATHLKLENTASELSESREQIKGLLEKEQAARRIAEAANTTKDEFISVVSHELRTPLNAIAGWTRILKSEDLSDNTKNLALQKIEKNLRLQTKLVEDLLNYSQLVSSRENLEKAEIDCAEIFESVFAEFEPIAEKKGIKITKENELNGQKVLGDADKIKIVIVNLLSNALKFTPRDGSISAKLKRLNDCIEIKITDNGRGISPDFLPHIFERFSQYDSSTTRKFGGLGLGLAVSHHIVKLHNGTIEANSEGEGKGSTFSVKLPVLNP